MDFYKKYKNKFLFIKKLVQKEAPVIIEVGSHYGEDSLRFLQTFQNPSIYCFEPDPRNIEIFKKFVKDKRIKLYEFALSNTKGEAEFFQSYQEYRDNFVPNKYDWISLEQYKQGKLNNSGSSSLKRGYIHNLQETIRVKTERFDNWYKDEGLEEIDFVWIDVQGAEKDVLEGMGDCIKNVRFVWIEYGELIYEGAMSRTETISYMNSRGLNVIEEYSDKGLIGDLLFARSSPLKYRALNMHLKTGEGDV